MSYCGKNIQPVTCVNCLGRYIRTQGLDQEVCLICQRTERDIFKIEIKKLTYDITKRNKIVERAIKKYGHRYSLFLDKELYTGL
jgi:hypothetical protein